MIPKYITNAWIEHFVKAALLEDQGTGDYTSLSTISPNAISKAQLLVKQDGIVAGVYLARQICQLVETDIQFNPILQDGSAIRKGDVVFTIEGNTQKILLAERLILNCMQRMSGVATLTHQYKKAISHTATQLLDTRKTTPLIRPLEKWAVLLGGGQNHRYGLFDMILIKDNHIDYAGGIVPAIEAAYAYVQKNALPLEIEVETRNLNEVEAALHTGKVNRILLDNMSLDLLKKAVNMLKGKVNTEASGGVDLHTIVPIAETGVDFISVGALTHSYTSLDLSLKAVK